jgi:hypothetical protein
MDIVLVVIIVVVALLGLVKAAQFGAAIRDNKAQLGLAKLQLAQQQLAAKDLIRELSERADAASEQKARIDGLGKQIEALRADAARAIDGHRYLLHGLRKSAEELQAAVSGELPTAIAELRQETSRQLQDGFQAEERISQARGAELRREITSTLAGFSAENSRHRELTRQGFQRAEEKAATAAQYLGDLRHRLGEDSRQAAVRFAELTHDLRGARLDIQRLEFQLDATTDFIRRQLEGDARSGRNYVLAGEIRTTQPTAADILPVFYDALCRSVAAEVIFREPGKAAGRRFYLRWHELADSTTPQQQFRRLFRACIEGDADSVAGARELENLLTAVSQMTVAAVQLGPMIAVCGPAGGVSGLVRDPDSVRLESIVVDQASVAERLEPECRIDLAARASPVLRPIAAEFELAVDGGHGDEQRCFRLLADRVDVDPEDDA